MLDLSHLIRIADILNVVTVAMKRMSICWIYHILKWHVSDQTFSL